MDDSNASVGQMARVEQRAPWRRRAGLTIFIAFMVGLIIAGVMYRHWAWDYTRVGRYVFDINRNYNFGCEVLDGGYLNLYENQVRDDPPYERKIDYPPLRLATFAAWAKWTRWMFPSQRYWEPDFAFNAFLIHYNTFMGLMGATAAFLIVRYWLRQCAQARLEAGEQISPWTGVWRATLAFTLLWFDPGIAIIGHGWPSPNLWVVPMYLWAVLFCLWDYWFVAGLVLAIGSMMQGQQLVVAWVFVLWPLLAGRPMRSLRWLSGFVLAAGLVVSGWMVTYRPDIAKVDRIMNWSAMFWVLSCVATLAAVGLRRNVPRMRWWWFVAPALAALVVIPWPAMRAGTMAGLISIAVAACLVWIFWKGTWSLKGPVLALTTGMCLLLCMAFWKGSTSWWWIGFVYGTERFPAVSSGPMVANLSSVVAPMFGWYHVYQPAGEIPRWALLWIPKAPVEVMVRHLFLAGFAVAMLPVLVAMAWHWRKKNAALLVALVLPWMLFYTLLPQMSPRYAVFVAGVAAICVGRSVFLIPCIWLFSLLTVTQTALCMIHGNNLYQGYDDYPLFSMGARELYESMNPQLAWPVVGVAGVMLALTIVDMVWRRRRKPAPAIAADASAA